MEAERLRYYIQQYPTGTRVQYTMQTPARSGVVVGHHNGQHVASILVLLDGDTRPLTVGTLYLRKVAV